MIRCGYSIARIRFAAMQACFFEVPMACRFGFIIAILTALFAAAPANAQSAGEASGIWLTQAGGAKVRVGKCGGGNCGGGGWLKDPIEPPPRETHPDDKKPKSSLARRPLIRLPPFSGLRPPGPNTWPGH